MHSARQYQCRVRANCLEIAGALPGAHAGSDELPARPRSCGALQCLLLLRERGSAAGVLFSVGVPEAWCFSIVLWPQFLGLSLVGTMTNDTSAPKGGSVTPSNGKAGEGRQPSWAVLEASNGLVHTLAGEDSNSPSTNFLVAGRSLTMTLYLPSGWQLRTVDSQFKIIDKADCPEVLEPGTVFGADYVEKEAFTAPRLLPRTERLSPKAYMPEPDPVEKGQLALLGAAETETNPPPVDSSEGDAEPCFRSLRFSLTLPTRELRLMTPTKGRRPVGPPRYHVDRLAFGQFVVVLEPAVPDALDPENRFVFVRSPLIQFFFRMDVCSTPGTKGPATWKVRLPQSVPPVGVVHEAISMAVNKALSWLNSTSPPGVAQMDQVQADLEEGVGKGEGEVGGEDTEEKEAGKRSVADTDSSDDDSEDQSTSSKRQLVPTGPRSRRLPKWREAYIINDGTTSRSTARSTAEPTQSPVKTRKRDSGETKIKTAKPEREESSKKAAATAEVGTSSSSEDEAAQEKKEAQAATVPPSEQGPDLTDLFILRLRQLKQPEILCPYKGCTRVVISLEEDCGAHFCWHASRGDLLLLHLLEGKHQQPPPKHSVLTAPAPSTRRRMPLPSGASVKKIAWEDIPLFYMEPLDNPKHSFWLWYSHIVSFAITDERVAEDCAAVPADAFGMKVCPVQSCNSVVPASRLEEHYRPHFGLLSIQRHRPKSKSEITAIAAEAGFPLPAWHEAVPASPTGAAVHSAAPGPSTAEAEILELCRTSNGRFAKRSKPDGGGPRKRVRRAKEKKPARKRGRPRLTHPAEKAATFTPAELPRLEPGKATAYGSANVLRQGALYTAVEATSMESDEEMDDDDCLLIDGISFGATSE